MVIRLLMDREMTGGKEHSVNRYRKSVSDAGGESFKQCRRLALREVGPRDLPEKKGTRSIDEHQITTTDNDTTPGEKKNSLTFA